MMIAILEGFYFLFFFKVEERKGSLYSEWEESRECFSLFPSTPLKKNRQLYVSLSACCLVALSRSVQLHLVCKEL